MLLLVLDLVCELFGHHFDQVIDLIHEPCFQVFDGFKVSFAVERGLDTVEAVLDVVSELLELVLELGEKLGEAFQLPIIVVRRCCCLGFVALLHVDKLADFLFEGTDTSS